MNKLILIPIALLLGACSSSDEPWVEEGGPLTEKFYLNEKHDAYTALENLRYQVENELPCEVTDQGWPSHSLNFHCKVLPYPSSHTVQLKMIADLLESAQKFLNDDLFPAPLEEHEKSYFVEKEKTAKSLIIAIEKYLGGTSEFAEQKKSYEENKKEIELKFAELESIARSLNSNYCQWSKDKSVKCELPITNDFEKVKEFEKLQNRLGRLEKKASQFQQFLASLSNSNFEVKSISTEMNKSAKKYRDETDSHVNLSFTFKISDLSQKADILEKLGYVVEIEFNKEIMDIYGERAFHTVNQSIEKIRKLEQRVLALSEFINQNIDQFNGLPVEKITFRQDFHEIGLPKKSLYNYYQEANGLKKTHLTLPLIMSDDRLTKSIQHLKSRGIFELRAQQADKMQLVDQLIQGFDQFRLSINTAAFHKTSIHFSGNGYKTLDEHIDWLVRLQKMVDRIQQYQAFDKKFPSADLGEGTIFTGHISAIEFRKGHYFSSITCPLNNDLLNIIGDKLVIDYGERCKPKLTYFAFDDMQSRYLFLKENDSPELLAVYENLIRDARPGAQYNYEDRVYPR